MTARQPLLLSTASGRISSVAWTTSEATELNRATGTIYIVQYILLSSITFLGMYRARICQEKETKKANAFEKLVHRSSTVQGSASLGAIDGTN
jgi:hypothetical protein